MFYSTCPPRVTKLERLATTSPAPYNGQICSEHIVLDQGPML
jgi:hypothetical protein